MEDVLYTGGYSGKVESFKFSHGNFIKEDEIECVAPSFLCFHPTKNICYAGSECGDKTLVSAYSVSEDGKFNFLNFAQGGGSGLCHVAAGENALYGACYNSGHVVAFSLEKDGSLGEVINEIQHVSSCDNNRQKTAHTHQTVIDPSGKWLIAVDLGTNCIHSYIIEKNGKLDETSVVVSEFPKNEGPRHIIFKNENEAYLLTELGNKVYKMNFDNGHFSYSHCICLTQDEKSSGAEIDFMPKTDFLFASVRSIDEIFVIDTKKETPVLVNSFDCGGVSPRMFSFSNDGKMLFVSNQQSDDVVVFEMDTKTGEPKNIIEKIPVQKVSYSSPYQYKK